MKKKRVVSKAVKAARQLIKGPFSREELLEAAFTGTNDRLGAFMVAIAGHVTRAAKES